MKLLLARLLFSKDGRKLLWMVLIPIFLLALVVVLLFSEQSSRPQLYGRKSVIVGSVAI
ncbi:hypothetical protein [Sporosarcina sp.]|uniref:hypothetical protein n=1 Tax=Sporosarcina sp. TaxID=49982 RepID=UPI0026315D60|nr:hypothetical protein [Sporosarcina sp.]